MGKEALCFNDRVEGIACMNPATKKIYQATDGGISVSKSVNTPSEFDFEEDKFKVKVINDNCRITTAGDGDDEMSVLMCYKDNENSDLLDIGDNMKEMDEELEKSLRSI